MRTSLRLWTSAVWTLGVLPLALIGAGCERGGEAPPAAGAADKHYDLKGRVVAVAPEGQSMTLDHEEIPGLMKAMTMEYPVADPALLEGLQPGDQVRGQLEVRDGKYLIIQLKKHEP